MHVCLCSTHPKYTNCICSFLRLSFRVTTISTNQLTIQQSTALQNMFRFAGTTTTNTPPPPTKNTTTNATPVIMPPTPPQKKLKTLPLPCLHLSNRRYFPSYLARQPGDVCRACLCCTGSSRGYYCSQALYVCSLAHCTLTFALFCFSRDLVPHACSDYNLGTEVVNLV